MASDDRATMTNDRTVDPLRTEEELVVAARQAMSRCNWTIGQCASEWCRRFSRGRSDAAFAELLGLSADQVYQRRRVWETFSDVRESYAKLSWSHFCVAMTWDDAAECLQWADDMEATVAEMRAWRRAQHGEDLSVEEEPEAACTLASADPQPATAGTPPVHADDLDERPSREPQYAPFSARAASVADREDQPEATQKAQADLVMRRIAASLEKCHQALTVGLYEESSSSEKQRVLAAIRNLSEAWL